jgi:hypothetical protein
VVLIEERRGDLSRSGWWAERPAAGPNGISPRVIMVKTIMVATIAADIILGISVDISQALIIEPTGLGSWKYGPVAGL